MAMTINMSQMRNINYTAYFLFTLSGVAEFSSCASKYDVTVKDSKGAVKHKIWSFFENT